MEQFQSFRFENRAKAHPVSKENADSGFQLLPGNLNAFDNFVSLRNFPWENLPVFNQLRFLSFPCHQNLH